MEFLESKRETNNFLLRQYYGISQKNEYKDEWFNRIIDYNLDIVSFVIKKEFNNMRYYKTVIEVGIVGLILALERYEMNKFVSFEEFAVSTIKNEIENFMKERKISFVNTINVIKTINTGDIWHNKTHLISETIETKDMRDNLTKRLIQDIK